LPPLTSGSWVILKCNDFYPEISEEAALPLRQFFL